MNNDSLKMIVKLSKLKSTKLEANYLTKENWFSRIDFLHLFEEVSPLFALIVFRHDMLVRFFLKNVKKRLLAENYFLAMCCNGAKDLFKMFPKRKVKKFLKANQFVLHPIHIASVFHNYELLKELIKRGGNVNLLHGSKLALAPLTLAIINNTEQCLEEYNFSSREKTVELLLCNFAMINMCKNGFCPLNFASLRGHENIVKLLLNKSAAVNLCNEKGFCPLYVACENGHDSIVKLLLNYDADVNLCDEKGFCPLYVACYNGHESIVQLLLNTHALM